MVPATLARVPTLDALATNLRSMEDLPAELVTALQTRCLLLLNALWSRQLATSTAPALPTEPDRLLTVAEAKARLSKSEDSLYRHARHLPFTVRVGRQLRFSSQGIARDIRERQGLR